MSLTSLLRRKLLGLGPDDISLDALGARIDPGQMAGLQAIVESVRIGFNVTLEDDRVEDLTARVAQAVEPRFVAFAHEGVGMALALLDEVRDRQRVARFFAQCIGTYDFFVPLGVGFALARIPWLRGAVERRARRFPPFYEGIVLNGYGFHQAFFRSRGVLVRTPTPAGLSSDAARCFDQGVGRATWFMCGGSPARIGEAIAQVPMQRQQDIWAGVGTACAFAGSAYPDEASYTAALAQLDRIVGPHREAFQVGVVLAAELTRRTSQPSRWVARTAEKFLGLTEAEAGALTERAWNEVHAEEAQAVPYAPYHKFALRMSEGLREVGAERASALRAASP